MKMSRVLVLGLLFSVVALGQQAKEPPATVADVEKAARKRVDSWLKERAPDKLQCIGCRDNPPKYGETCTECKGSHVNERRLDNAFWRYLAPSFRQGKQSKPWLAETLAPSSSYTGKRWRSQPLAVEQGTPVSVLVSRDVVWTWVGEGYGTVPEAWVFEDGLFYISFDRSPGVPLVKHPWFLANTFSMARLGKEIATMLAPERDEAITEIERERRAEQRRKAEDALRERACADVGILEEVSRDRDPLNPNPALVVTVVAGCTRVTVEALPREGETQEQLERRLGDLQRGQRLAFRGRPSSWPGSLGRRLDRDEPGPAASGVLTYVRLAAGDAQRIE